ncbi:hypothetical protein BcepSauron_273 [Burkholderia phage BcepSauron]|uniref:Uncharacterized protein n=1 Tax=Burkholderia phage BcepSauron TaxID=2530033 RepID=A0A482MN96_9CAUD|nr:hypothetical protein H1O17_gp273 [Burkholderia phage BcepSauron]QBQ74653.1 hypothetical protein BcepSauron_273 [Burkholderia phage BcepSauron]
MALLFSEGWDSYATITDVANSGKYKQIALPAGNAGLDPTNGRFGGRAFCNNTAGYAASLRCDLPGAGVASGATFYVAGWWRLRLNGGGGSNLPKYCLVSLPNATLLSYNGSYLTLHNNTTTPVATGTTYLGDGYHWIEVSFTLNGANSQVTAYVDGVQQFSGTYNLSNHPAQVIPTLFIGTDYTPSNNLSYLDDFLIWDTTGTDFNTFPVGARRIGLMNPAGAGDSTQFAPSAGANWQVASQPWTGTATLTDATTGKSDLYTMSALPYAAQNVNAVVVNTCASNPGADAQHSVTAQIKSNGTVVPGAVRSLVGTNVVYSDVFTRDSAGSAWTVTSVNAAQVGMGD